MKLRKTISKTSIVLCAAVLAGAPLASNPEAFHLSNIAITAEAANQSVTVNLSNSYDLSALKTSNNFSKYLKDLPNGYSTEGYKAIYSTSSGTTNNNAENFIIVYNPDNTDVEKALKTPNGREWANNYATFLTNLSQISGVRREYLVFVLNTDLDTSYPGAYHGTWFHLSAPSHESMAAFAGIINNKFSHGLLHETSHAYCGDVTKSLFNSSDEVYTNFRAICALHRMGNKEIAQNIITGATAHWKKTATDSKTGKTYKQTIYKPSNDQALTQCLPEGSTLRSDLNQEFVTVSEVQNISYHSINGSDSVDNSGYFYTRLGTIFSFCTNKPIWYSYNTSASDCNNWLNTDAINENWNSIDYHWLDLYLMCVNDEHANNVDEDIHGDYLAYITFFDWSARATKIKYKHNGVTRTVKITNKAKKYLDKMCTPINGVYNCSGNLLQTCNMLELLNVPMNATVSNGVLNTNIINYYKKVIVSADSTHAYVAPHTLIS